MQSELSYKDHAWAVVRLGAPLVAASLSQMAIHITDTLMIGWYGVPELAALVLGATFYFVLFLLAGAFGYAIMPVVAAAAEEGDTVGLRRATRMGLWLVLFFSILFLPLMMFSKDILILLGQETHIADMAQTYLRIAGWGLPFATLFLLLRNYLAALEKTQIPMWIAIAMVAVNAVLNYALIFGNWGAPELGIAGSAIASLAVVIVEFILVAVYARWVFPAHEIFLRLWRSDWEALFKIFKLGWPIGLTSLYEVGLFAVASLMMGWISTTAIATHGIALQWASITFMIHYGLSSAATIRAGQSVGHKNEAELRRGGLVVSLLSGAFSLVVMFGFVLFPEPMIRVFLDPADPLLPEIIALGTVLLLWAAIFQTADSTQVIALGLLRGVQDTRGPMFITFFSYWIVGLPVAYWLGFKAGYGPVGIWIGLTVGLFVASMLLLWRFWGRRDWVARVSSSAQV